MKLADFCDMNISENILKGLSEMGLKTATEIQDQAIEALMNSSQHFVGQAQTGTGKTAAFSIPVLERINFNDHNVQALILTPTRELARQIESEILKIGKYTDVKTLCIYGGTGYEKQVHSLKVTKPHVVVGTPGRVIDLIKKGNLKLNKTKICVLDEADEMLNMGFLEDVQIIIKKIIGPKQLMMFSATMPNAILKLIDKSFSNHKLVQIENKTLSNKDIDQRYFVVRDKHFKEALARLVDDAKDLYGIIFCRTKIETKEVGDDLKKRGFLVEVLNGDMGQAERDLAMAKFKKKKVDILVCTDVAARGIDVADLTHVFNFGLPRDNESYIHRIGRTGRAGKKGRAYTIVGPNSAFAIGNIAAHIKSKIIKDKLPSVESLKRNLVNKELVSARQILEAITDKGDEFKTEESFELVEKELSHLSKEDLLKMMFVWKFNKPMRRYNNLADIEQDSVNKRSNSSSRRSPRRRR